MFRNAIRTLALLTILSAAACNTNSIVGPGSTNSDDGGPTRQPVNRDKVCIEGAEAVQFTSPSESRVLHGRETILVTWETRNICFEFVSTLRVSYDAGTTWSELSAGKGMLSALWTVPTFAGVRPVLEITVESDDVVRTQRLAISTGIFVDPAQPDRDPAERD